MQKKRLFYFLLSVLSGLLLVFSFPHTGSLYPLVFVALVPLLILQDDVLQSQGKTKTVFFFSYFTFLIYNVGAGYWVFLTKDGALKATLGYIVFTGMMTLAFWLYHLARKHLPTRIGYLSLFIIWISFEFGHYHWDLDLPWLNLGNVFALAPQYVQWYSLTGVLGGTLWVLAINFMVFRIVRALFIQKKPVKSQLGLFALSLFTLLLPALSSLWIYTHYEEVGKSVEIVITQPNIDTYTQKFTSDKGELIDMLTLVTNQAEELMTDNTAVVLAPETVVSIPFESANPQANDAFNFLQDHVNKWETVSLVAGAGTFKFFDRKLRNNMKFVEGSGIYYELYDDMMVLTNNAPPSFAHKSKLVVGIEKIPLAKQFPFLEQFAYDYGESSGTLGVEPEVKVLRTKDFAFAPVICYESIYGGYVAEQCRKKAEAIFIITNDAWWGNSAGHKQHNTLARLRAVENRKYVARSANTGISSIINQRGDVVQATRYEKYEGLRGDIRLNKSMTFYTKYGDFIGRGAATLLFVLTIYGVLLVVVFRRKSEKK